MVRGRVVLNIAQDPFHGLRLVIVEPVTAANLAAGNGLGGGTPLVAADPRGAAEGQMVAFVEGREAANPWWPDKAAVDACCAVIVDSVDFRPAENPEDRK